jgi:hypothetical protein
MQGGNGVDDPDMSLQSTVALATLPLHDGSGDGSSLEEMLRFPTFRRLMWLSFRSRLAISHSLCCAQGAARRLSAATLFRLKITSSRRGALARTRCAHLSYEDGEREDQPTLKVSEKINITIQKLKSTKAHRRRGRLTNLSFPLWESIGSSRAGSHE